MKELTWHDLDTDTEDEMIEDKIDNNKIEDKTEDDDKIEDMIEDKIDNNKIEDKINEDEIEDKINEDNIEVKIDDDKIEDKERTMYLDKINEQIDQANLLARIRNDSFSKNVEEICELMNELQDEIDSDDSWLRLFELNKINVLLDGALDYVWKTFYGKNREKHGEINIDKDKDIDEYVNKYTNIVNDKLELVNRIGELLDSTMIDVQNEVGIINEVKQASEIDIDTLKSIRNTLIKNFEKVERLYFRSY